MLTPKAKGQPGRIHKVILPGFSLCQKQTGIVRRSAGTCLELPDHVATPQTVAKLGAVVLPGANAAQDYHLLCLKLPGGNPLRFLEQSFSQTLMLSGR